METSTIIQAIFVILLGVNTWFLSKIIKAQKKLTGVQSEIIDAEKKDLSFIREFVEDLKVISKEMRQYYKEREEMIKKRSEEEKAEIAKGLEARYKEKAQRMVRDIMDLIFLVYKISSFTGAPAIIETYIGEMPEGVARDEALKAYERAEKASMQLAAQSVLGLMLKERGLFKKE